MWEELGILDCLHSLEFFILEEQLYELLPRELNLCPRYPFLTVGNSQEKRAAVRLYGIQEKKGQCPYKLKRKFLQAVRTIN